MRERRQVNLLPARGFVEVGSWDDGKHLGAFRMMAPEPTHEIAMLEQRLRGLAALLHYGRNESDGLSTFSGHAHRLGEIAVVRYHHGALAGCAGLGDAHRRASTASVYVGTGYRGEITRSADGWIALSIGQLTAARFERTEQAIAHPRAPATTTETPE